MTDEEQSAEEAAKAKRAEAEEGLRAAVGQIAAERTTESGKACVAAAQRLIDIGELVEARHWVSLSLTADKAQADVKLHKALRKLDEKNESADKFTKTRKGAKAKLQAVE